MPCQNNLHGHGGTAFQRVVELEGNGISPRVQRNQKMLIRGRSISTIVEELGPKPRTLRPPVGLYSACAKEHTSQRVRR
jgi:hypothetical protein